MKSILVLLAIFLAGSAAADDFPLIIAHRGASAHAPDNTIKAIELAVEAKADWIEFDVRVIADGSLILQHDGSVRVADGTNAKTAALTLEAARAIDVGEGERMPLLSEAIAACGEVTPLIEHKTGSAEAYLKVIRDLGVEDQVIVQSFNWGFLRDLRQLAPQLPVGMLGSKPITPERLDEILELKPNLVGWKFSDLTEADIKALSDAKIETAIYTVNDPAVATEMVELGVDAIITDRPAEIRAELEKSR